MLAAEGLQMNSPFSFARTMASSRCFMNDSFLRSAPHAYAYETFGSTSSSQHISRMLYNNSSISEYLDDGLANYYHSVSRRGPSHAPPFRQSIGIRDDLVRRTNLEALNANSLVVRPSSSSVIYPMMTLDGIYPRHFATPRRLAELFSMRQAQLDSIMRAYELEALASRGRCAMTTRPLWGAFEYGNSSIERHRTLVVLFQYLGAYQLAEAFRYGGQEEFDMLGAGYNRFLLGRGFALLFPMLPQLLPYVDVDENDKPPYIGRNPFYLQHSEPTTSARQAELFPPFGMVYQFWEILERARTSAVDSTSQTDPEKESSWAGDAYQDIEPLTSFDWSSTEPIQIRVFKPKFHLTMALENCPLSEYLLIDNTYLDRVKLRQSIMDEYGVGAYGCNVPCESAVFELYEWIFGTYLPKRFPTMFQIVDAAQTPSDAKTSGPHLLNIPTGEYIPLIPSSAKEALYTLGRNVDEEFLVLLPSSKAEDGTPFYHLEGYVCCSPAGFSLPQKLSLPLASIHTPVPGYKAKLEKSMDRFFAKLELGKAVRRFNWSISTSPNLYLEGGNHLYAQGKTTAESGAEAPPSEKDVSELEESIAKQKKEVKIESCRLRSERQTVHRMPKTGAIVFGFKTYQYKLEDVKAEGNGPALADAIDGLKLGNVPDMQFYKRGVVWGEPVQEYLRS